MLKTVENVMRTIRQQTDYDMTVRQTEVLCVLDRRPGVSVKHLAQETGLSKPAMTRCIDRLYAFELVTAVRCTIDRRMIEVRLTQAGKDALASIARAL